jgi:hypothetical protein
MFTIISYFKKSLEYIIGCTTSPKNYSELLTTTPMKAVALGKKSGGRRVTTCLQAVRHQIGCLATRAITPQRAATAQIGGEVVLITMC